MHAEQTGAVNTEAETTSQTKAVVSNRQKLSTRVIVNSRHSHFRYDFFLNLGFADIFWQESNSLTFSGKSRIRWQICQRADNG